MRILLWNRLTQSFEEEQIFAHDFMKFAYGHPLGMLLEQWVFSRRWFSKLYGWLKERPHSRQEIATFVQRYGINLSELAESLEAFQNYQAFFLRSLKPEARPVDPEPHHLIAPADARLLVLVLHKGQALLVKGRSWCLRDLLGNDSLARSYAGGTCLIYRLAPMDYHHHIYVDTGWHRAHIKIPGALHSVSPLAQMQHAVFPRNERQWTVLHTQTWGDLLQIEVGALVVGRIHQLLPQGGHFMRGQAKGWFALGGSTIIQILQPKKVIIDPDIWAASAQGIESLVRLGSRVGQAHVF